MSILGKQIRLRRIFSDPSGRILAVAIDHLVTYPVRMPEGLRNIGRTIASVIKGKPSSITMFKGTALRFMSRYAGQVPLIVQQVAMRPHSTSYADHVTVEEVVGLGADAIAVTIFLKGDMELRMMRQLATVVREAEHFGLPVVVHAYPLKADTAPPEVSNEPEDVFYAARVGLEMGADVIKTPYTGDVASFKDIVSVTPIPVVAAGGPRCESLDEAVAMIRNVVASGAAGATVGRNAWGFSDIPMAIEQLKDAVFSPARANEGETIT